MGHERGAEPAGPGQVEELLEARSVAVVEHREDRAPCPLRHGVGAVDGGTAAHEGLLAHDVRVRLESRNGLLFVEEGWRAQRHGVVVGDRLGVVVACRLLRGHVVDVADGVDAIQLGELDERPQVGLPDPGSDDGDVLRFGNCSTSCSSRSHRGPARWPASSGPSASPRTFPQRGLPRTQRRRSCPSLRPARGGCRRDRPR